MSAQDNSKLIHNIYEMFNSRDFDGIIARTAEDMELLSVPFGMTLQGPAGYYQYLQSWAAAFPDSRIEISNIMASEDGAVVEFRGKGTHTGPLVSPAGEIPATGKSVDIPFCDVLRLKNGKITSLHNYYDTATMMRQLGLISE